MSISWYHRFQGKFRKLGRENYMNILKQGSKLLSVGLLALSLSTGFGGLALARGREGGPNLPPRPAITATPNPVTLNRRRIPSGEIIFTLQGSHLQQHTRYVINDTFHCRTDNLSRKTVVTNSAGQFSLRADLSNGCTAGNFRVTLNQGNRQVASTQVTVRR
jgi:hypothetical protein